MVKASKGAKAIKELAKIRKDLRGGPKRAQRKGRNGMTKREATTVLAQGAVAVPRRNFGTVRKAMASSRNVGALLKCLDARLPRTLGLPRAVGPYTVIRTTKLHQSSSSFVMFAPFQHHKASAPSHIKWCDWCGIEAVVDGSDISLSGNTRTINMPMTGLGDACECVPASLTVQVMNPASLQTAEGVFAMTRVNQQLGLGSSPAGLTYDDMAARVISFYAPRILTGGKLALRGVKADAYPLDMSEYAHFAPIYKYTGNFAWSENFEPSALSPIVFVQNNATNQTIEFMVTIEWRVRFDPGNPATAGHAFHDTLSDELWNGVVKAASAAGHGVVELSEDAAAYGVLSKASAVAGIL